MVQCYCAEVQCLIERPLYYCYKEGGTQQIAGETVKRVDFEEENPKCNVQQQIRCVEQAVYFWLLAVKIVEKVEVDR